MKQDLRTRGYFDLETAHEALYQITRTQHANTTNTTRLQDDIGTVEAEWHPIIEDGNTGI
jgi:hypothetical protein